MGSRFGPFTRNLKKKPCLDDRHELEKLMGLMSEERRDQASTSS